MRPIQAALFTAAALAATPAAAQSFTIGKIVISGVTSVPTGPLYDSLQEKPGQKVTTDDVLADQDRLIKSLETAHITGGVKTSLSGTATKKDVIFAVTDNGVAKPVVTTTALHIAHVTYVGNKNAPTEQLEAAAQMKPGDVVTDKSLADAGTRISAAYKKASANVHDPLATSIQPQMTYPTPGQVDIVWQFTETTTKAKKKRDTEDQGFKTESN
jgi:outer membrane protein assembly factor BamA